MLEEHLFEAHQKLIKKHTKNGREMYACDQIISHVCVGVILMHGFYF